MSIKFEYIHISDFMSLGDVHYPFNTGVTLVLGANKDSEAADDNGAGKSSLVEALRWCLYGETVRNAIDKSLTVQHVIRDGAQKAVVSLGMEINGTPLIVQRWRNRKTADLEILFTNNGEKLYGLQAKETLEAILGINVIQFSNLVHLDGSYPKLFAPSTDAERKEILGTLVDAPIWENIQSEVSQRLLPINAQIHGWESQRNGWVTNRDTYKQSALESKEEGRGAAKSAKALRDKVSAATGTVQELEEEQQRLAWQIKKVKQLVADETKSANEEVKAKEDVVTVIELHERQLVDTYLVIDIKGAEDRVNSLSQEVNMRQRSIAEKQKLQRLGKCPTCSQDTTDVGAIDIDAWTSAIKELQDEIKAHRDACTSLEERRNAEIETARETLQRAKEDRTLAYNALSAIQDKDVVSRQELEQKLAAARAAYLVASKDKATLIAQHQAQLDLVKRAKERWENAEAQVKAADTLIAQRDAEVEKLEQDKATLDFWRKGFGPKGVPSLFIETILPQISAKIQKYADILTGGDVLVSLKAYTETQSKTVKEAIQISAVNTKGASVYGSNSTGERNRINLAVTLGLIDYFRSVHVFESSLLVCDEIFDGLDSTGVEAALEALDEAAVPSVIVVSHHEHLKPLFSSSQYVVKENGVSSLL